jgi:hypothetical protein
LPVAALASGRGGRHRRGMWCAGAVIAIAVLAAGCSSRDEIHCAAVAAESASGINPLAQGMSMCFESRSACEPFESGGSDGPRREASACVAVPRPDWHCTGHTGTQDPIPFDTCLPSRALCETLVAARREWEDEGTPSRTTPCRAVPTVACGIDDARSMLCESTAALCEAGNDLVQRAMTPPPPPRRCELRASAPR